MRVVILGGGNLTNALLGSLIAQEGSASDVAVVETDEQRRMRLSSAFGVRTFSRAVSEALDCDVLVLAVKPQEMREACQPLTSLLKQQLVISIASGIRLADLSHWLQGYEFLVRAMPNTLVMAGIGITGLIAQPVVSDYGRLQAERLLRMLGNTYWFENEALMDSGTALLPVDSVYAFLRFQAMQKAAGELSFACCHENELAGEAAPGKARSAFCLEEISAPLSKDYVLKSSLEQIGASTTWRRSTRPTFVPGALVTSSGGKKLGEMLWAC